MKILYNFDGSILDDALAEKVLGELIKYGLVRPTRSITPEIEKKWGSKRISESSPIGVELLSDQEVDYLMKANPQKHGESGFGYGWPARFATYFKLTRELGYVYYEPSAKIQFSELGIKLADSLSIEVKDNLIIATDTHPELEQQAFLNSLVKFQRNNPFVRVLNENSPLILLLQVITKLNNDEEFKDAGILKQELPLIIYWKDNDAQKLYLRIKRLRKDFGYSPSNEVITAICRDEIMQGKDIARQSKSIMVDYPDEFIRKMRLTGLITLRGGGRFVGINTNEQKKVDYILSHYTSYAKFTTQREYFNYASLVDKNLIDYVAKVVSANEKDSYLRKWSSEYSWAEVKEELSIVSNRRLTKDEILKYIPASVRLEFLIALAIKLRHPNIKVVPNYPVDDEGLPTSTALGAGDKGDVECLEDKEGILVEVTMAGGRVQTMMEVWPIERHLQEFRKKHSKAMAYFIAPSIYADSKRQIEYVKDTTKLFILPKTIKEFTEQLEANTALYVRA